MCSLLAPWVLVAAFFASLTGLTNPSWPVDQLIRTVVLTFAGRIYTGIPLLVLIFSCARIWE